MQLINEGIWACCSCYAKSQILYTIWNSCPVGLETYSYNFFLTVRRNKVCSYNLEVSSDISKSHLLGGARRTSWTFVSWFYETNSCRLTTFSRWRLDWLTDFHTRCTEDRTCEELCPTTRAADYSPETIFLLYTHWFQNETQHMRLYCPTIK